LEKELSSLQVQDLKSVIPQIVESAVTVSGNNGSTGSEIRVVAARVEAGDLDQLKDLGDALRNELKSNGVGLLASIIEDKVQLVCVVTDDLTKSTPAGKLVGIVAKELGGGGGGKPHMATAGAKDVTKLDAVLTAFPTIVSNFE